MVKVDITEKNFNFANGLSERNLTDMRSSLVYAHISFLNVKGSS